LFAIKVGSEELLRKILYGCWSGVDWPVEGYGPVEGSLEHGNEAVAAMYV